MARQRPPINILLPLFQMPLFSDFGETSITLTKVAFRAEIESPLFVPHPKTRRLCTPYQIRVRPRALRWPARNRRRFQLRPFGGDGETFISPSFTYTAIADFNGVAGANVNGVVFNDPATPAMATLSPQRRPIGGFGNYATGTSNALLSDFFYTGDGSGNATMTLTGLTIGHAM
jgi:hypothetical protein